MATWMLVSSGQLFSAGLATLYINEYCRMSIKVFVILEHVAGFLCSVLFK